MEIIDNSDSNLMELSELEVGEVFVSDGALYIKTEEASGGENALLLTNYLPISISTDVIVEKVNAVLTITNS